MNKFKTIEEVKELVDSCNESGLSKKEYAKSVGLTTHQLYWYFRRFNRQINPEYENSKNKNPGFKKINIPNSVFMKDSIKLKYGKLEISIPEDFNSENLKQIIETLEINIHG